MVAQQQDADAALASTQAGLRDLVETHRVLLSPEKNATFHDRLSELILDGQQIGQFYNTLNSK